jgi:hypothetical protein
MIFVSGPAIARLMLRTRKWAHEAIRRGNFGPVSVRGGVLYVDLLAVQSHTCITFTDAQIDSAGEGMPDRIIRTQPNEDANGADA